MLGGVAVAHGVPELVLDAGGGWQDCREPGGQGAAEVGRVVGPDPAPPALYLQGDPLVCGPRRGLNMIWNERSRALKKWTAPKNSDHGLATEVYRCRMTRHVNSDGEPVTARYVALHTGTRPRVDMKHRACHRSHDRILQMRPVCQGPGGDALMTKALGRKIPPIG